MALPKYVSTEWVAVSSATLYLKPPPPQPLWWWLSSSWWWRGVPFLSTTKHHTDDHHTLDKTECFLSSLTIKEYGERRKEAPVECEDEEDAGDASVPSSEYKAVPGVEDAAPDNSLPPSEDDKDDLRPPGLSSEMWDAWLVHWENWREVVVSLSWVHKYREQCTPEYIEWHDSYIKEYPEMLPVITEELDGGTQELAGGCVDVDETQKNNDDESEPSVECDGERDGEAVGKDETEGTDKKVWDGIYEKHRRERYLLHLRTFLLTYGMECNEGIDAFFKREAGVSFTSQKTAETQENVVAETLSLQPKEHQREEEDQNGEEENDPHREDTAENQNEELSYCVRLPHRKDVNEDLNEESGDCVRLPHREDVNEDLNEEPGDCDGHSSDVKYDNDGFTPTGSTRGNSSDENKAQNGTVDGQTRKKRQRASRRSREPTRATGTGWTMNYIRAKCDRTAEGGAPVVSKTSPVAVELPEASPALPKGTLETACGSAEEAGCVSPDAGCGKKERVKVVLDELKDAQEYFELMNELERKCWNGGNDGRKIGTREESVQTPPSAQSRQVAASTAFLDQAVCRLKSVLTCTALHLLNLVFPGAAEPECRLPPSVFGIRWLPQPPDPRSHTKGNRQHQKLQKWLHNCRRETSLLPSVSLRELFMHSVKVRKDVREWSRVCQEVVRQQGEGEGGCPDVTLEAVIPLSKGQEDSDVEEAWNIMVSDCQRLSYQCEVSSLLPHLPRDLMKFWAQRYRLFLKYDRGVQLDNESWYSVTPELIAAHQARRCGCQVVVDAMCGAGGNAIQLARTCGRVMAIDKDPRKVELARHNAEVYGVADRIEFMVGDFFELAPHLEADVVYLSPPWGGMEYTKEKVYDVYALGGTMNCIELLKAAKGITPDIALYLPRTSDLYQVIALAGRGGAVDIESSFVGNKMKAITAYFGSLATKCF